MDWEIAGMNINIHAISTSVNILVCTSIGDIHKRHMATPQDIDLQRLKSYIIQGWPQNKDEVEQGMQRYWQIRHDLAMIDCIATKQKNTCIFYIVETNSRPITQQVYGHKNETFRQGVSVLGEYECRH